MKFSVDGFVTFLKGVFKTEEGSRVEPEDWGDTDFANDRLSFSNQTNDISSYNSFILGCESQARIDDEAMTKARKELQNVKEVIETYKVEKQRDLYVGLMQISGHWFNKFLDHETFPDLLFKVGMKKKLRLKDEESSATGNALYGIEKQIELAEAFFRLLTDTYSGKGCKEELMKDVNQILGCYRKAKTASNSDVVSSLSELIDSISKGDVDRAKEDLERLMKDDFDIKGCEVVRRVNPPEMGISL